MGKPQMAVDISALKSTNGDMFNKYGKSSEHAYFKIADTGDVFTLPHYNFNCKTYFTTYVEYLEDILNKTNLSLVYFEEREGGKQLNKVISQQNSLSDLSINELLENEYNIIVHDNTQPLAFYVVSMNQNGITNNPFQGQCIICYTTTCLRNRYSCNLPEDGHHGICQSCYDSWRKTNYENTCPMCRAE